MSFVALLRSYFFLGSLATVAAVVGIAGGVSSLARSGGGGGGGGGGGSGLPGAMTYVPQDQGGADSSWQQLLQQMTGAEGTQASTLTPFLQNAFANSGYGDLTGMMRGWGGTLAGQAGQAYGAGQNLMGAGGQLWSTALDPQNALHDALQQQTVDESRAATSARGIGMSAQSAGMESEALDNFNTNWQNQQLGRQLQGMQGLTSAYNASGQQSQLGNADLVGAQSMYQGAGALPFNLAQLYSGGMNSGVYQPAAGIQGQIGQYLGLGQSGSNSAFGQGQTGLNNFTTGLQQLGQQPWLQNFFASPGAAGSGYQSNAPDVTNTSGYGAGAGP